MKPVFSIVIPLYNKARTIGNAIESVLSQTFSDFETIVVNDGSSDKSAKVVAAFTDKRLRVLNPENRGAAGARNLGIMRSEGQYIAFLDADDVWEKDQLEELLKLCRAFPEAGLYCMGYRKVYSEKVQRAADFKGLSGDFFGIVPNYFDACSIDSVASASSVCVPAAVFDAIGFFNTAMHSGEDTEMWIRIALHYQVALNSKITANYDVSTCNSLSKTDPAEGQRQLLSAFTLQERNNPALKKYIDLNRYALGIKHKIRGDRKSRKAALRGLNRKNLNFSQRLLLLLPGFVLKPLKQIQSRLAGKGIFLWVFGR